MQAATSNLPELPPLVEIDNVWVRTALDRPTPPPPASPVVVNARATETPAAPRKPRKTGNPISRRTRASKRLRSETNLLDSRDGVYIKSINAVVTCRNVGEDSGDRPYKRRRVELSRKSLTRLRSLLQEREELTARIAQIQEDAKYNDALLTKLDHQVTGVRSQEAALLRQSSLIDQLRRQMGPVESMGTTEVLNDLAFYCQEIHLATASDTEETEAALCQWITEPQDRAKLDMMDRMAHHTVLLVRQLHATLTSAGADAAAQGMLTTIHEEVEPSFLLWGELTARHLRERINVIDLETHVPYRDARPLRSTECENLAHFGRIVWCAIKYKGVAEELCEQRSILEAHQTRLAALQAKMTALQPPTAAVAATEPFDARQKRHTRRAKLQQKRQTVLIDIQQATLQRTCKDAELAAYAGQLSCALAVGVFARALARDQFDLQQGLLETNDEVTRLQQRTDTLTLERARCLDSLAKLDQNRKKLSARFVRATPSSAPTNETLDDLFAIARSPTVSALLCDTAPAVPPPTSAAAAAAAAAPTAFTCSICYEDEFALTDMVFSSCGHSACQSCANRVTSMYLKENPRACDSRESLNCSVCRQKLLPMSKLPKKAKESDYAANAHRFFYRGVYLPVTGD